jgi:hypothetical protein
MLARHCREPVFHYPPESPLLHVQVRDVLRDGRDPKAAECRPQLLVGVGDDHLALDPHVHQLACLLELPGAQPPQGGKSQVDAVVLHQVLRRGRWWPPLQVLGRSHHGHAPRRPDAHRDHVLRHLVAGAHPDVEAVLDDVAQRVVDGDLDAKLRVVRQDLRERGQMIVLAA